MARTPAVVYILSACGSGAMEAVAGRPVGGRLPPRAPPSEALPVAAPAGGFIGGVGPALGGPEADGYCPGPRASSREGCVMQTVQDRLTLLLRRNRTIYFCDGCLALKMGEFSREGQCAL